MKALDDALASLRLRSVVTSRCQLSAPWGLRLPGQRGAGKFHLVQSGRAFLELEGQPRVEMRAGDFAISLAGHDHVVRDAPHTPVVALEELLRRENLVCESSLSYVFGGGGAETRVLSGMFLFEDFDTHPLLRALPELIVIRGDDGKATEWLETTLAFLACEATSDRPGGGAVVDHLLCILFVQAVRAHVKRDGAVAGWLRAVRDPQIGRAIAEMHLDPARDWTLERLADEAAMSRSNFAAKFRELAGETPGQYLARWRMHRAVEMMRRQDGGLAEVAYAVGYESEAAFSKAFKRIVGQSPGRYRGALRQGVAA